MAATLKTAIGTAVRRIAAKILGDYTPPRLHHASELIAELDAAVARQVITGEWVTLAGDIVRALKMDGVDHFLRFPPITRTLHPRIRSRSGGYLQHLLHSPRFTSEFQRALTESPVGRPLVNPHYPLSSPLLVQHGYHVIRLTESTDIDLQRLGLVVEFGGGYGGFFRLLRNLGYREKYLIWDLPAMCALQRFYLRNVFPTGTDARPPHNVSWLGSGDPGACDVVIRESTSHRPSLFVATWSLSETPLAVREEVASAMSRFSYVLCAYQRTFGDQDNVSWFSSLEKRLPQFSWQHAECPVYRNNFYLIGAKIDGLAGRAQALEARGELHER